MKQTICLSEDEIREIIARDFFVKKDDVKIRISKESRGYGMNEHLEDIIYAVFDVPKTERKKD